MTQKKDVIAHYLLWVLISVLIFNQYLIGTASAHIGIMNVVKTAVGAFKIQSAGAMEIMMPMLNEDGSTTHLQMMPTITEVSGESGDDDVARAKMVMLATGAPFYAPDGISFNEPIKALFGWQAYEKLELSPDMEIRYTDITESFPCNFCCGSALAVAVNSRCGCAHAGAARGFFRYMLSSYGNDYTNEQLFGEAYRWQALWYPSGVVEDYLLGTGRRDVLGHSTHGGAGADGMHGFVYN